MIVDDEIVCPVFLRKTIDGRTLLIGVMDESISKFSDAFCIAKIEIDIVEMKDSPGTIGVSYPSVVHDFGKFARAALNS